MDTLGKEEPCPGGSEGDRERFPYAAGSVAAPKRKELFMAFSVLYFLTAARHGQENR